MSTKAVLAFTERVSGDPELQRQVKAIWAEKSGQAERMAELGQKVGFEFSAQEFVEAAISAREMNQGELTEDELESVAGTGTKMVQQTLSPQAIWEYTELSLQNIKGIP